MLFRKMRVSRNQPIMEGQCFGFGREILEGVNASGAKVAVHGPELRIVRLAWLYDLGPVLARPRRRSVRSG